MPPTCKIEPPSKDLPTSKEMIIPGSSGKKVDSALPVNRQSQMFPFNLPAVMWCQQNGVICYSATCKGKWDEAKQRPVKEGFSSERIKGRSGWCADLLRKDYTLVMTQCGTPSGLLVIDLDVLGGKTAVQMFGAELMDKLYEDCGFSVDTGSGGKHYYFRIPEGKRWTKVLKCKTFAGFKTHGQLDILADGTGIVMEGSTYPYQDTHLSYTLEQEGNTMDDITEMPEWLIDAVDEASKSDTPADEDDENAIVVAPVAPPRSSSPNVKQSLTELSLIASLVKGCLPPSFFGKHDNWFRFICCLKSINNTDACKEICVSACKTHKKYNNPKDEADTRAKWDSITPDGRLTQGTLRYWCKENNEKKYNEILRASYEILLLGSVNEVAQVFASDIAGSIVYDAGSKEREPSYWRYDEAQRIWGVIGQSALDYHFVDTMPTICDRVRRDIIRGKEGDEVSQAKAKYVAKIYGMISQGGSGKYTKPLQTLLNPASGSANFKDAEFSLNDRPELLPLSNGVFNFKTGKLEMYERNHFLSYKLNIRYNPDADTSDIQKAMRMWYENNDEVIEFMKYWLGYCLTGYIDRQEFMIVYGATGGNGKSLLFEEILGEEIMGNDLYLTMSEDALSKRGGHNDSLYNAEGKRLCVLSEASKKGGVAGFNIEAIKKWTGGGRFSANAKFKNEKTFIPQGKLAMLVNALPELPANCGGIARRYLCIKQNTPHLKEEDYLKYSEEDRVDGRVHKQDPEFVARLRANKEGWIKWLVEGAMMYMANPKRLAPQSVLEYSNKARAEGDVYSNWLLDNMIVSGKDEHRRPMAQISGEFIKNTGRSSNDTKSKCELISRIKMYPRVKTEGKVEKGRLSIVGVVWNIGCDPSMDDDAQATQEKAYESWLGGRSKTTTTALEFLSL